jgi:hypothetical protein
VPGGPIPFMWPWDIYAPRQTARGPIVALRPPPTPGDATHKLMSLSRTSGRGLGRTKTVRLMNDSIKIVVPTSTTTAGQPRLTRQVQMEAAPPHEPDTLF